MKTNLSSAVYLLLVLLAVYFAFSSLLPSNISDKNTPLTEFSTERAFIHLKEITKKPHYVGTEEHNNVKNYLIKELEKLGLQVSIQEQIGVNKKWRAATKTQNILARIKGSESGKALLIMTHYDSAVHSSFGASDAGSGVVAILEGIRAYLEQHSTAKNDIIILFTDAEEVGLLGADAFVNHHPWTNDVGLVLNFEARGSGGPSYMLLETNGGNKKLIQAFRKAKPKFPVANSLMYSIYKALPNDTDLTVFREDGNINGFNFAFIDDHYDYHTAQDTYHRLDKNTLEQQGDYLMTMLPYFANVDLANLNEVSEDIYFSFPKIGLITYPFSWVLPMFILAAILFFVITFIGVQKRKLTTKAMFAGFVPFLGSLILAFLVTFLVWKLIKIIHPQYNEILHGFTYNGHLYIAGFVSLTLVILFWFYKRYFKLHSAANLLVAPLFIWGIINVLIVIYLKGAGFFIIPVYLGLISLAILLFSKEQSKTKYLIITLLSFPTILIFAPLLQMFPVGLGLKMLPLSAIFTVLIFGLLTPILKKIKPLFGTKIKHGFVTVFLGLSFILFIKASFSSGYTKDRRQPTSLNYVFNADSNEAFWASFESKTNDYNKAYLGEKPTKGSFDKSTNASKYNSHYKLHKKTEVIAMSQPIITKVSDTIVKNERKIRLQIQPQRHTTRIEFIAKDSINYHTFNVNGVSFNKSKDAVFAFNTGKHRSVLTYYFTEKNEVLDLEFSIPKNEDPELTLYDIAYDLYTNPFLNVKPRQNETMMPTPFVVNDASVIIKKIKF
jgi:hypothetical protein